MPEGAGFAPVATRRMVLVHGAWQGAWAFDAWTPSLERRGWRPEAVDLPGNGCDPRDRTPPGAVDLARCADHVRARIDSAPEPVVLVGHSGGGLTATAVAEAAPERVEALVYLAGMMLPSGMGFAALLAQCRADDPEADLAGIGPWLRPTEDGLGTWVDPAGALAVFLHDADPALARRAAARLRPQPRGGRDVAARWTPERMGRVPRVYVEARDDRSIPLSVQRRMQRLVPGAATLSLDCGHVPQLVRPEELTRRLCDLLEHGRAPREP